MPKRKDQSADSDDEDGTSRLHTRTSWLNLDLSCSMPVSPPEHIVEHVNTLAGLCDSFRLRATVFTDEQGFSAGTDIDQFDSLTTTQHFVIRLVDNSVAATVRVRRTDGGYYKLERVCVRKDCRKYGFGGILVEAAHKWAREDAASTQADILCLAQLPAIPFYERFGYVAEGDLVDDEGVPHRMLRTQLSE